MGDLTACVRMVKQIVLRERLRLRGALHTSGGFTNNWRGVLVFLRLNHPVSNRNSEHETVVNERLPAFCLQPDG